MKHLIKSHKFERMIGCGQPIESNLHRHLTEHLNAEVVLRTITDLDVAMQWLSSTFLCIRARKNPHHYGINATFTADQIDKKLLEMCQIDLNKLVKTGMLIIDQNINITPTVTGMIMAKFYVAFETMKLFTQITGTEILIQILALISKCQEFVPVRLRVNDKKTLNLLNKNSNKKTIRFTLNGRIKTWDMKVNCIIQAVLGNLDISDHSILSESLIIMRNGERLAKCLIEYLETKGTNCYNALFSTIILSKCFHVKLWENSPYVSKQLTGIGSVMSTQLANAGKTSFKKILDSNPRDIEIIIKRKPSMGNAMIEEVEHIPSYKMTLEKTGNAQQLQLCIQLENADVLTEKCTVNSRSFMILLVGNSLNEILIYEKYKHSYMMEKRLIRKIINITIDNVEYVNAHFISDNWVGIDCNSTVEFQGVNPPTTDKKCISKKTEKEGSTYIQTFLDMYMKIKKKPTNVKANAVNKDDKPSTITKETAKATQQLKSPSFVSATEDKMELVQDETEENPGFAQEYKDDTKVDSNNGRDPKQIKLLLTPSDTGIDNSRNEGNNDKHLNRDVRLTTDVQNKEDPLKDFYNLSDTSIFSEELREFILDTNSQELAIEREIEKILDKQDIQTIKEVATNKDGKNVCVDSVDGIIEMEESDKGNGTDIDGNDERRNIIDFDGRVTNEPSLFLTLKKYGLDNAADDAGASKRKINTANNAMEFGDGNSFCKEEAKKRQKLEEFKFPPKKKFSHQQPLENLPDSTVDNNQYYTITQLLEPRKNTTDSSDQNNFEYNTVGSISKEKTKENVQKSIKWRSPLVFSPAVKFSPKMNYQNTSVFKDDTETETENGQNELSNETFNTSISSKSNINLTVNIQRSPNKTRSNTNSRYVTRNRGTQFALCDKDYNKSTNNATQEDDVFDICSTSMIEELGLPVNQHKYTSKSKKSPTVNYYSQLLSQPIQVQKRKTDGTPRKDSVDNAIKNTTNENKENCNAHFPKKVPDKMYSHPKLEPDTASQYSLNSSQQIHPNRRENIPNQLQDVINPIEDSHGVMLAQNKPISYSSSQYIPQTGVNNARYPYIPQENRLQRRPIQNYTKNYPSTSYLPQNYEAMYVPNYPIQDFQNRYPNVQNLDRINPEFHRFTPMKYYIDQDFVQHTLPDIPSVPQRCQFNPDVQGTVYRDPQNVPMSVRGNFERKLSNSEMSLNRSRLYNNPNTNNCYEQRKYSQYFENNATQTVDFPYERISKSANKRDVLQNSRPLNNSKSENTSRTDLQRYPEMMSFQDLTQQQNFSRNKFDIHSQNTSTFQRKSFEDNMNEKNDLRNNDNLFSPPALKIEDVFQDTSNSNYFMQNNQLWTDPNLGSYSGGFQKSPQRMPQREYFKTPRNNTYDYADNMPLQNKPNTHLNHFDNLNDGITKTLKRSLSFEEKSNFDEENVNFVHNTRLPEQTYNSQRYPNHSFSARNPNYPPQDLNLPQQDFRYQNNFVELQSPNFSRSTVGPPRNYYPGENYHCPSGNEHIEAFYPNNDKEYVINKFFYSLDQQ